MKNRTLIFHKPWLKYNIGDIETFSIHDAKILVPEYADIIEKTQKVGQIKPEEKGLLSYRTYRFFEKLKKEKRFLIEEMLYPKTTNMLYSPPGEYKSFIALEMGLCISTGKPFLGLKTQKNPVLYCDAENNAQTIKKRLMALRKGLKIRSKDFPLLISWGEGSLDEFQWIEKLKKTVLDAKIKLVIFDTLHRFSAYEENKADDLNRLYTTTFQPLINQCDCSILFLHHTKKDGGYRGTSDFLGQVDCAYAIKRTGNKENKIGQFCIKNEKNRWGEIKKIEGHLDFSDNNAITFSVLSETDKKIEKITKISLLKEVTQKILEMFPIVGTELRRIQIFDNFEMMKSEKNPDSGYSVRTIERSISWLSANGFLEKNEKNKYVRVKEGGIL